MATWKKIIVSGSNISQLINDAGYVTQGSFIESNAFATASFNGTNILADSKSGALNFASGSGQGLTISANSSTDTLTFGLSAIPNSSLANSSITIAGNSTALGGTVTQAQILAGSGVWSGSAQLPAGVVSGSSQVSYTGLSNIPAGIVSSSAQVTSLLPVGTVSGSSQITYSGISGIPSGIISGSGQVVLSSPAQGEARLTINGTAQTIVDLGLQSTDSPTFAGVTAGNITVGITNDNTINTSTGNLTINSAGGLTTLDNNVIVSGDLTVNGTTTTLNTAELYVEDKFVVLASGSATAGDGGIIIDRGSDARGNVAFGYDEGTTRFGFQNGLIDTSNAIDLIKTDGTAAFVGLVFTEASHGATRPTTGEFAKEGAIYTATSGDIWIYS